MRLASEKNETNPKDASASVHPQKPKFKENPARNPDDMWRKGFQDPFKDEEDEEDSTSEHSTSDYDEDFDEDLGASDGVFRVGNESETYDADPDYDEDIDDEYDESEDATIEDTLDADNANLLVFGDDSDQESLEECYESTDDLITILFIAYNLKVSLMQYQKFKPDEPMPIDTEFVSAVNFRFKTFLEKPMEV